MGPGAFEGEDEHRLRGRHRPPFRTILVEAERCAQGFTHGAMIVEPTPHRVEGCDTPPGDGEGSVLKRNYGERGAGPARRRTPSRGTPQRSPHCSQPRVPARHVRAPAA